MTSGNVSRDGLVSVAIRKQRLRNSDVYRSKGEIVLVGRRMTPSSSVVWMGLLHSKDPKTHLQR